MPSTIAGTFTTGSRASQAGDMQSGVLVIPNVTQARLTVTGASGNNRLKLQKSTNSGSTWADQSTYNSDQAGVPIVVAPGEHWRFVDVAKDANREIRYKLTVEN